MKAILTQVIFNGILLFAFQQWIQRKFRKRELAESRETLYMTKSLELMAASSKALWATFAQLEIYLMRDLPEEIRTGSQLSIEFRIRQADNEIRAEMANLPNSLWGRINGIIEYVAANTRALARALEKAKGYAEGARDSKQESEILKMINTSLNALQGGLRQQIDDLKRDYPQASREAFFKDYAPEDRSATRSRDSWAQRLWKRGDFILQRFGKPASG